MISITPTIFIDEDEIKLRFIRSSGPGGQKVNTSATAVQLRFDVLNSPSLPQEVRKRLLTQAAGQISSEGILIIDARSHRHQLQNRKDAQERLITLIKKAAVRPKPRKKTKPSRASQRKRLEKKKKLATLKRQRQKVRQNNGD